LSCKELLYQTSSTNRRSCYLKKFLFHPAFSKKALKNNIFNEIMEYRTPFYKLNVLFYEGLVIMKKILAAAVGLAAAYTVIPTVFIRSTSYGIVQNNGKPC